MCENRKRSKTVETESVTETSQSSKHISPLAPKRIATLPPIAGVRLASCEAGVRYKGRTDVMMAIFAPGTQVAGVFTKTKTASAPVDWCRESLAGESARALVVNSGNANAFTGKNGVKVVKEEAQSVSAVVGCKSNEVFIASTGVIGEPLPVKKITAVLDKLAEEAAPDAWHEAAQAIMTTDTYPKLVTASARIGDKHVTINGIAKGSGMIAPNMGTMLSFIVTDATLPAGVLQTMLSQYVEDTYNSITVDSDTSTSDTLLLFATGKGAAHDTIESADAPELAEFREKLHEVMMNLALQIVRDGEGMTKFIQVDVTGAENDAAAKKIAYSIANSPLVKTAMAGNDANWGRVVAAVGKSGEKVDRDKLKISFGDVLVAEKGDRAKKYSEEEATAAVSAPETEIGVDIGVGHGKATVYTCDLTHGYIDINGSYRS